MSFKKKISVLLLSLTFTCLLLLNKENNLSTKKINSRQLFSQSDQQSACSSINNQSVFGSSYIKAINNVTWAMLNYKFNSTNTTPNTATQYLGNATLNFLKKGNSSSGPMTDYIVERLGPYVIFLVFAGLSIIVIFFYCTCCCCPSNCCQKTDNNGDCCRNFSFISVLFFTFCSIVICIVGFIYSSFVVTNLNGVSCAFFNFYFNLMNGQNTTIQPMWTGIGNAINILNKTSNTVSNYQSQAQSIFVGSQWTKNDPETFSNSMNFYFNQINGFSLPNPNPANNNNGVSTIKPIYVTSYGSVSVPGSYQNTISSEYNLRIQTPISIALGIYNTMTSISAGSINFNDTLNILRNLNSSVNNFTNNTLGAVYDNQDTFQSATVNSFYVFFSFILFFVILNVICLIAYCSCKTYSIRYVNHISWFILSLIVILTFILGPSFTVIGTLGLDISGVMYNLFSPQFLLNGTLTDGNLQTGSVLNICVNGNGNFINNFAPPTTTSTLDALYNSSILLTGIINNLKNATYLQSVVILNNTFTSYQNSILNINNPSDGVNSIQNVLNAWQAWSDSNQKGGMSSCPNAAMDFFTDNQSNCLANYTLISPVNPTTGLGQKSCLIINQWTTSAISSRYAGYASCGGNTGGFSGAQSANVAYQSRLSNFIYQNFQNLVTLINANNDYNNQMTITANRLISLLTNLNNTLAPFYQELSKFSGNNGFNAIFNCKFVSVDLNNLLQLFGGDFSLSLLGLGILLILNSFFSAFIIFFTIFTINFGKNIEGEVVSYSEVQMVPSQKI